MGEKEREGNGERGRGVKREGGKKERGGDGEQSGNVEHSSYCSVVLLDDSFEEFAVPQSTHNRPDFPAARECEGGRPYSPLHAHTAIK